MDPFEAVKKAAKAAADRNNDGRISVEDLSAAVEQARERSKGLVERRGELGACLICAIYGALVGALGVVAVMVVKAAG